MAPMSARDWNERGRPATRTSGSAGSAATSRVSAAISSRCAARMASRWARSSRGSAQRCTSHDSVGGASRPWRCGTSSPAPRGRPSAPPATRTRAPRTSRARSPRARFSRAMAASDRAGRGGGRGGRDRASPNLRASAAVCRTWHSSSRSARFAARTGAPRGAVGDELVAQRAEGLDAARLHAGDARGASPPRVRPARGRARSTRNAPAGARRCPEGRNGHVLVLTTLQETLCRRPSYSPSNTRQEVGASPAPLVPQATPGTPSGACPCRRSRSTSSGRR